MKLVLGNRHFGQSLYRDFRRVVNRSLRCQPATSLVFTKTSEFSACRSICNHHGNSLASRYSAFAKPPLTSHRSRNSGQRCESPQPFRPKAWTPFEKTWHTNGTLFSAQTAANWSELRTGTTPSSAAWTRKHGGVFLLIRNSVEFRVRISTQKSELRSTMAPWLAPRNHRIGQDCEIRAARLIIHLVPAFLRKSPAPQSRVHRCEVPPPAEDPIHKRTASRVWRVSGNSWATRTWERRWIPTNIPTAARLKTRLVPP